MLLLALLSFLVWVVSKATAVSLLACELEKSVMFLNVFVHPSD
jgi:hypothetical protein